MDRFTYLNNENTAYIDSLYEAYQQDPASVDYGWQKFFEGFDFGKGSDGKPAVAGGADTPPNHVLKEINVLNMINGYRSRGHLFAY
jgi:2-oxoglutarate dehydrogenase E1 component